MGIRITYNLDRIDGSTAVASSEANSDLAASNAINDHVNRVWRATGDTSEWIRFDMATAQSFNVAAILGHNFTSAATVTLERSTDAVSWTSVGTFTILTDSDGNVLKRCVLYFSAISYRYWRITIADAANPDTYVEIGRVVLGTYYEPPRNYSDDYAIEFVDPSEEQRSSGRDPIFRQQTIYRRATCRFIYMTDAQRLKFQTIFLKVGNTKPMLITLDPAASDPSIDSLYCSFLTPMRLLSPILDRFDAMDLVFEERT